MQSHADRDDLQKFLVFLRSHNPFTAGDQTRLRNTSAVIAADHRVNVDDALNIGAKIQERLTGNRFGHVTMKNNYKTQTFSITRTSIKVDSQNVPILPEQLYHRLL